MSGAERKKKEIAKVHINNDQWKIIMKSISIGESLVE